MGIALQVVRNRPLWLIALVVLVGAAPPTRAAPLRIEGPLVVPVHTLVRLRAVDADPEAALLWRVTPRAGVSRATTPRGVLEFTAKPGVYEVDLASVKGHVAEEISVTVTIGPAVPDPGTTPPAPMPPGKSADPVAALGRLTVGRSGCTATVIAPRRIDGRWDVLSASHCTGGVGTSGSLRLKDGRTLALTVTARNTVCDITWFVTDSSSLTDLPFAVLATADPVAGTRVWQAGYGVNQPTVRKEGTVTRGENRDGQIEFRISVSSGDSGGGIFRVDNGEWLAAVCCTSSRGSVGNVFGGSALMARLLRPASGPKSVVDEWVPMIMPLRNNGSITQGD